MKRLIDRFFNWYEKHLTINITLALGLFLLQLIHLFWLFTDVVLLKLTGRSYFPISNLWQTAVVLVDYTEIPALFTVSLIYINELRKKLNLKSFLFLMLLLSQVIHIFWITDEFVVSQFTGQGAPVNIPGWLAWVAIAIDYLEIPVIIDTTKKLITAIKSRDLKLAAHALNSK